MRTPTIKPTIAAAAIVVAAGALAAGLALKPAIAGPTGPNPDLSVTCTSGSPCQTYKNKGLGAGIEGINTKNNSSFTSGVVGSAGTFGNGVNGFAGTSGNGVNGTGGNTGVSGTGGTWGVFGFTNTSFATGVEGQSDNGDGVVGFSVCCNGVDADSNSGNGLVAIGGSNGVSIFAVGGTHDDIVGSAGWGGGVTAVRGDNGGDNGSDGDAAEFYGSYIGVIARSLAGSGPGFPIVATDQNGNNLMWVDGAGDIFYHGSLNNFLRTRDGNVATSFAPTATAPTIEDNGTAQLVGGVATVQLDATFAKSIDLHRVYQVMLTPDGDTKGLYIASKSPTGFVVREVQGGHNSIAFDYHIYAPSIGQAGTRMTEMSPAQAASYAPHAAIVKLPAAAVRPKIKLLHK